MENNININKKNKYFWIVIVFAILLVGGTLASVISDMLVNNGRYNTVSTCLTVDYDITNDDGTMPITGALFPTVNFYGGLSGKVGLKINDSCSLEGIGSLYLNVSNNTSPIYVQTVDAHCEDSRTLETLTDYDDESACTAIDGNVWVTNGTALKYAVFDTNEISGETIPVSVGYVNKVGSIEIYNNIPVTKTLVNFYVYIWLDGNLSDNSYANIPFDGNVSATVVQKPEEEPAPIIYKDSILNGADPVLDEGMIPVMISNTGVATVADISTDWYDYSNKKWANVVLVNENATDGVEGSKSREYYLNNPGTTVLESDILAYYVWVPRYKYKIWTTDATQTTEPQTIDIVFEGKNSTKSKGTSVGDYLTHPAFTFGDDELNGIWVGKFETSTTTSSTCYTSESLSNCNNPNQEPRILPNVKSLRYQTISNRFQTSLKFAGGTLIDGNVTFAGSDTYGLTTDSDSHMMKNSEWGAVAYLSHSKYGINQEIYINNSSGYYTGRSGGGEGTDSSTYGTYSWIGQTMNSDGSFGVVTASTLGTKASTTGNLTGVYDMSGGVAEYVMGVFSDLNGNPRSGGGSSWNSGFNGLLYNGTSYTSGISFPDNKYYDLYLQSQFNGNSSTNAVLCTLETCAGHALSETMSWYNDKLVFIYPQDPWFIRGGFYSNGVSAGLFYFNVYGGGVDENIAMRSVISVSNNQNSYSSNKYLVVYDANGGTGAPLSQTKSYGDELILSNTVPKRDGYTFLGWSTSSSAKSATYSSGSVLNLNDSVRLYAVWEITKYKDSILNGADPVLDEGMIPVMISNNGVATVADVSQEWYDYSNKEWANVVLVDSTSRSTYINQDGSYNSGVTIPEENILAYYVWVPRYKYKIWTTDATQTTQPQTINIVFEDKDAIKSSGTSVGDYLTHPAFTFGDEELNGIWVGKFETTGDATTPTIKPNLQSLRSQNVSTQFQTSLKFAGGTLNNGDVSFTGNNTYGLTNNIDSHMMKNSEWGAVAYLSHSQYGINGEIYINNSSGFYTGRSGGAVGGIVGASTYGTYSWTGQAMNSDGTYGTITDSTLGTKASTTGNITGVYDMSGGAWEYVMGVLSDSNGNPRSGYSTVDDYNSGFNGLLYDGNIYTSGITFPNSKYYNLYSESQFNRDYKTNIQLCTLETCGGHALSETASWYDDKAYFIDLDLSWFIRGGSYANETAMGMFFVSNNYGYDDSGDSWRSVLVVEN